MTYFVVSRPNIHRVEGSRFVSKLMRYVVVSTQPVIVFPLSVLVLHYWSDASIFQLGDTEPFQQRNRSYSSFKLQFDVCDNKVVIAANIPSSSKTICLKRTSCKDRCHLPLMRRWSICFLSLWLGEIQVSLCISLFANRMTKLLIPQKSSTAQCKYSI